MFAVLQISLDQTISREALEAAVMATQSLAKPDCRLLQRELFGIVAGRLGQDEALAMQAVLRDFQIETEVVAEDTLPKMPPPKRAQAFRMTPAGLHLEEFSGQEWLIEPAAVIFAAAGHVFHLKSQPYKKLEWTEHYVTDGLYRREVEVVTDRRLEDVPEFRLEFFVAREPFRWQWILDAQSVLRANDTSLRLRDKLSLEALCATIAGTLPPERVNRGIRNTATTRGFCYPSVRAFEEELVWLFYRLLQRQDSAPSAAT